MATLHDIYLDAKLSVAEKKFKLVYDINGFDDNNSTSAKSGIILLNESSDEIFT
ncbi:hypothetical protein MHB42_08190 [Lysinibacillus sp. FSL K6-0232]|uniref:hypothetical protein n=1 Tax=unclassified Lysinibacillus TaxID=2636778 RepID=UPI0030F5A87E